MIILDCEQRSDTWHEARLGVVTASNCHRILTPSGELSGQSDTYMNELLAEHLTGKAADSYESEWMTRGKEVEDEARDFYEFQTDNTIRQVGFVYKDEARLVGCSPDGLYGLTRSGKAGKKSGGLEIKCPKAATHVGYMYSRVIPLKYTPQPQFSMWITGFEKWAWLSYHPDLPHVIIPVARDEAYIARLAATVNAFTQELQRRLEILRHGAEPLKTEPSLAHLLKASLELLERDAA